jgi:hypothetical protein
VGSNPTPGTFCFSALNLLTVTISIERLIWEVRRERGETSEQKVASALSFLFEEGRIDGFERSMELDRRGVDFLVKDGSKNYKISVKSSQGGVEWEKQKHPKRVRKGDLIFVVPGVEESIEDLALRIFKTMQDFEERMHQR